MNTVEDPGRFMDEDNAERFGVVCFEAFDHEFDRTVILFDLLEKQSSLNIK